ncbi:MAG: replicative DNA helicase [Candidatus Sumerlaeaceae bacterium]|nr:replicative DNA helicase [Candidatus Sumerlaeaceae bacterium]
MSEPGKVIDTALPSSPDAEKAVLGAMILDPEAIVAVSGKLLAEHFYKPRHQQIYAAIQSLYESQVSVDFTTLVDELKRRNQLEAVGGPAYLASLVEVVFTPQNVEEHARIIRSKHRLREIVRVTQEIHEQALREDDEPDVILAQAEQQIFTLSQGRESADFVAIDELTMDTMTEIERRRQGGEALHGVQTGFPKLDELTGGFQRSDLLILAARPSVGKTALALNIALNVGAGLRNFVVHPESARPVAIFSLEMSASQIDMRMLSTVSKVPMYKMRTGHLNEQDRKRLHAVARQLHGIPIYIDDTPGLSILELRAKARRLKARVPGLALVMVDYLQLMRGAGRVENRQQEIAEITRSLKALARELDLPVLALSQLNRQIDQRKGKNSRPVLSDLRESGAIEQDADVVMFIHRDRKYEHFDSRGEDEPPAGRPPAEPAELIIAKQRNGPTDIVDLVFFRERATFHSMQRGPVDDHPGL